MPQHGRPPTTPVVLQAMLDHQLLLLGLLLSVDPLAPFGYGDGPKQHRLGQILIGLYLLLSYACAHNS